MNESLYKSILDDITDGVYFVDSHRMITYWNKGAENITGYKAAEVIGSHCYNNILKHVDTNGTLLCLEECPLAKTIRDGTPRKAKAYLHHREGHRVPVLIKTAPIRDKSGVITGAVEIFHDNSPKMDLITRLQECRMQSWEDSLTGLGNRRYAEMHIGSKLEAVNCYGLSSLGIAFIDIDHFKRVNDQYGHDSGDEVLKMLARTLKSCVAEGEVVCRWGGEEFVAILSVNNNTDLYSASEKLRTLVEQSGYSSGSQKIIVTVSVGATLANPGDTMETLIQRADRLMYQSKKTGRNRVSVDFDNIKTPLNSI